MSRHDSDVTQASISLWHSAGASWQRVPRFLRRVTIVLVVVAIPWLIATIITQRGVDARLAAIRSKGEALTLSELAPRISPGVLNAATIYESAFSSMPDDGGEEYEHALADPAYARDYLAAREAALEQLRQAADVRDCAFPIDWSQPGRELTFPHYAHMRAGARLLTLDSSLLSADGKADQSLDALGATGKMAAHTLSEPILIGNLVAYAVIEIAHSGLEESLSLADPSPAACRKAYDDLARIDVETPFRRAMMGERLFILGVFEDIRAGRVSMTELSGGEGIGFGRERIVSALYPTLGRPLFCMDEASALDLQGRIIEASDLPWPQSMETAEAVSAEPERLPFYRSVLTRMIFPVFARADWSQRRAAAILTVDRAALAVKAFKAQTGRYPDTLAEVEALGWDLPDDPLTGKPLLYRRTPNGFNVWSAGPNQKDDNATEYDRHTMDYTSGPYDITFVCDPQRIAAEHAERKAAWDQQQADELEAEKRAERTPDRRGRGAGARITRGGRSASAR